MTRLYVIVFSIIFVVVLFIMNFIYIIKSEQTKSNLLKETQFQQITIDTISDINKKQSLMIKQYRDLQLKNKNEDASIINDLKNKYKQLNDAKSINQQQMILQNLFNNIGSSF